MSMPCWEVEPAGDSVVPVDSFLGAFVLGAALFEVLGQFAVDLVSAGVDLIPVPVCPSVGRGEACDLFLGEASRQVWG